MALIFIYEEDPARASAIRRSLANLGHDVRLADSSHHPGDSANTPIARNNLSDSARRALLNLAGLSNDEIDRLRKTEV